MDARDDAADPERVRAAVLQSIGFPLGGPTADTWGLFGNGSTLSAVARLLVAQTPFAPSVIAGVEAAGFALGAAVAATLGVGFVPIRRGGEGRLPGDVLQLLCAPDYKGRAHLLRMQTHACGPGDRALVVDDWTETGSQLVAARTLLLRAGVDQVACGVVVDELTDEVRRALEPYSYVITAAELDEARR